MSSLGALKEILLNRKLARLGDSYVNFVYSLALTKTMNEPAGCKVSDSHLAEAARRTCVRGMLPKRTCRADVANAVEALLVHSWLNKVISLDETVNVIMKNTRNPPEAFIDLINEVMRRLGVEAPQ